MESDMLPMCNMPSLLLLFLLISPQPPCRQGLLQSPYSSRSGGMPLLEDKIGRRAFPCTEARPLFLRARPLFSRQNTVEDPADQGKGVLHNTRLHAFVMPVAAALLDT